MVSDIIMLTLDLLYDVYHGIRYDDITDETKNQSVRKQLRQERLDKDHGKVRCESIKKNVSGIF